MEFAAFCARFGRGTKLVVAASLLVGLGGCSNSVTRFDFPAFNLTKPSEPAQADYSTTSAVPIPPESVYASGSAPAQYVRHDLPPATASDHSPRPTPVAYTPASPGYVSRETGYSPKTSPLQPAVLRTETEYRPAPTAGQTTVTVKSGDTLSAIAIRHGVSVDAIMAANNLQTSRLDVGQKLIIPGAGRPAPAASGQSYTVQRGDSLYTIAKQHGVDHLELAELNGVKLNATLQPGQQLKIPAGSRQIAARAEPAVVKTTTIAPPDNEEEPVRVASTSPDAALPTVPSSSDSAVPGSSAADDHAEQFPTAKSANLAPRVTSVDALPEPEPMSGARFRWPVRGRIIAGFGTKPDGGHNDGINVAVPQGTAVQAAENGVVAYAGSELKGYGNLILIRHANNWVSAYAHNEEILVKRGDKVRRGQVIARAGKSGNVSQPQVHFELRKGSRPVDPVKYMSDA